jgi:NADPH-dependent 2,4-dienoyl-CoA reductase/sulfur reductase-like enzyme
VTGQRVVVVGGGLGGLRAAEQLRAAKFDGSIVVVGDESHLPYNRPPLSKEGLLGELAHETVVFRRKAAVDDVEWRLGERVAAADLVGRTVTLDDGTVLEYDGLVGATGARARRLPLEVPLEWRHVVRTLDDATRLRAQLRPGRRVVVVGAGFIGCEVAATARLLGCEVTVVDPLAVPLVRPLGERVGNELRRRHEEHGVEFRLGRTVATIRGTDDGPTSVELDDGAVLAAEVVVEAVGSTPNVGWLDHNGLDLADGVRCDGGLRPLTQTGPVRTAVVVGDIARFPNPLFDSEPRRVEHWNVPTETAKRAARVLAADLAADSPDGPDPLDALPPFTPMPAFWSDQYDLRLQSFGLPGLGPDIEVLEGELTDECAIGYHRAGVVVGVVLLGLTNRYTYYRDLVAHAAAATV